MSEMVDRVAKVIRDSFIEPMDEGVSMHVARRAIEAMRYVDSVDETVAVNVSRDGPYDPVICIEIHDAWLDAALS